MVQLEKMINKLQYCMAYLTDKTNRLGKNSMGRRGYRTYLKHRRKRKIQRWSPHKCIHEENNYGAKDHEITDRILNENSQEKGWKEI